MHIRIGEVETLRTEDWSVIPYARREQVEIVGGFVEQDFGRIESGDNYSCSVTVTSAGANKIGEYWSSNEAVTVRDVNGLEIENLKVTIKRYGYVERFKGYVWAELEFQRKGE